MKLLFSDIHANKQAARDVEKLSKCFTDLIFCGDICGFGKDFKYCIDMFKDLNVKAVMGNHDILVLASGDLDRYSKEVAAPILWTRKKIKEPEREYLRNLPVELELDDIYVIHSCNFDDYILTEECCKPLLKKTNKKRIAIGHTHVQAKFEINGVKIINPGSITKGRQGQKRGYAIIDKDSERFVTLEAIL
jgi:putative phosphoesterase